MTKMMIVDKQFLADIYGIAYEVDYDRNSSEPVLKEVFSNVCREHYPTVQDAYTVLVSEIKKKSAKKIKLFEELSCTFKGRVKLFRHSLGLLPAKNMKYLTDKLEDIKACREDSNIPSMESLIRPLGDKFLISTFFVRPHQKLYVFVKAHSIHFDSNVYEAQAALVSIHACEPVGQNPAQITMNIDVHSLGNAGEEKKHFRVHWNDFSRFNDDYFTTDIKGEYVFADKDKCLEFAKSMMNSDIDKIKNNITNLNV